MSAFQDYVPARASNNGRQSSASIPKWVDSLTILAVLILTLRWTWFTWPDPLVDFGRELSVPWQITLGHTLYKDISYLNGPFSPYFNAAWMKLIGVCLSTIVVANLTVLSSILVFIYLILTRIANRTAAVLGTVLFIPLFGCGRLLENGNYNFVCPYSHDLTHGIALSLAAISCLHLKQKLSTKSTAATGLLLGLVLLTKLEVALACFATVSVGFYLRASRQKLELRLRLALVFVVATLVPGLIAFSLLSIRMPFRMAVEGLTRPYYLPFKGRLVSLPYYRHLLGTDELSSNLLQMFTGLGILVTAVIGIVLFGLLANRIVRMLHPLAAPIVFFFLSAGASATALWKSDHWFFSVPKAIPIVAIFLLLLWLVHYRGESERSSLLELKLTFTVFALLLVSKIFLNTGLFHYGFALAMPATLLLVSALVCWIPAFAAKRGAAYNVCVAAGVGLICVFAGNYLFAMSLLLKNETYRVGIGSNAFTSDERGVAVQRSLEMIERNVPPGATLTVLPEGSLINVLSRRPNPTPHNVLMPVEFIAFGETQVLEDFRSHPPDFVLLCHKDTTEYGAPLFGKDFGQQLDAWLHENYVEVAMIGNLPFQDPDLFGMLLLRHR